MSRNKFIVLIVIAITLLSTVVYLIFKPAPNTPINSDTTNTFPDIGTVKNPTTQNTPNPDQNIPNGTSTNTTTQTDITTDPLFQVATSPTAGGISFMKDKQPDPGATKATPKQQVITVRYVNKANGFIFEKDFGTFNVEKKISTTTIPHIEDAFFLDNGTTVIMRYLASNLETIQTFVGTTAPEIVGGDSAPSLRGYFLPENIKEVAISADGKKFFHLFDTTDGVAGTLTNISTNKKNQFFTSAFSEWLPSITSDASTLFLNTKAGATVPGFLYKVTVPNNTVNKVIGGVKGLTSLPNTTGDRILYADNTLALKSLAMKTGKTTTIGLKTMPEKCIWTKDTITVYCFIPNTLPGSSLPDLWYQGSVSFTDSIWKINTDTGATTFIDSISTRNKGSFDAIKLFLSPEESTLFFINKKDYTLWGYSLNNQ
jgi:hypothetical protein